MDKPPDESSHSRSSWKLVSKRQTQRRIKSAVEQFFNTTSNSAGVSDMLQHHHSTHASSMNDGKRKVCLYNHFNCCMIQWRLPSTLSY
jgi:hypothetical protein